jgi:hypothetical protein
MDTELLVEPRLEDGEKLVNQLELDGFEVRVAFWVRTSEEGLWHLYIASPAVTHEKLGEAYRAVYASLSKVPAPTVSLSEIKLVSPDNPIVRDVLDIPLRYSPDRLATSSHKATLGSMAVEEVYVYPPTLAAREARAGRRQTKVFGLREVGSGPNAKIVPEEIGVVGGHPNDEWFSRAYKKMITAGFGSVDNFHHRYPRFELQIIG